MKRRYDSLCSLLGQGLNVHLSDNALVRDILELGEPLPKDQRLAPQFKNKSERVQAMAAADKCLTQLRGRQRAKRAALCQAATYDWGEWWHWPRVNLLYFYFV